MSTPKIHNGLFTIRNKETGNHRTFRIRTQPKDSKFAPGERIIGLLIGPENTRDYKGFGFVNDDGIRVWHSRKGTPAKPSEFETFAQLVWLLATEEKSPLHHRYEVMVSKRCLCCNRELTTPESLISGIGPVCAGR